MSESTKRWTVITEQDPDTGDLLLPLPEDLLEAAGFSEGDDIEWTDNGDGSYTLSKSSGETEWVLVDTISQFRMRYMVEVPKGVTSHRVITEQEGVDLFRSEDPIFANWDDDTIKKNHFTFWIEDQESNSEELEMEWPACDVAGP